MPSLATASTGNNPPSGYTSGTATKRTTSPATPTAQACTTSSAMSATQTRTAATRPCSPRPTAAAAPPRPMALPGPRCLTPSSPAKTSPSSRTIPTPSNFSPWSSSPPSGGARSGWRPAATLITSPRPNSSSTPTKPTRKTLASASAPSSTTPRTSRRRSSTTKLTPPRSTTWPSCPIRGCTSASPRCSTRLVPSRRQPPISPASIRSKWPSRAIYTLGTAWPTARPLSASNLLTGKTTAPARSSWPVRRWSAKTARFGFTTMPSACRATWKCTGTSTAARSCSGSA